MKLVSKLNLVFIFVMVIGALIAGRWIDNEAKKTYSDLLEQSLIEKSRFIASSLGQGDFDHQSLPRLIKTHEIYTKDLLPQDSPTKKFDLYVTNHNGKVLYHSQDKNEIGKDYSRWNDVYLTLRNKYGARSSRIEPDNPLSSIYYIASPILKDNEIIGVVSVFTPKISLDYILSRSQSKIGILLFLLLVFVIFIVILSFNQITKPFEQLKAYINNVSNRRPMQLPNLPSGEFQELGLAIENMKNTIDEKNKIENHVQNLIHELKSPLTSIHAASEIIEDESINKASKEFAQSIQRESTRIKNLLNSLLTIARLEKLPNLENIEKIDLSKVINGIVNDLKPLFEKRKDQIIIRGNETIKGNPQLIYQALRNILQNIIDHADEKSQIDIQIERKIDLVGLHIENTNSLLPEYAKDKIFDKFFSLPQVAKNHKSSGLGLSFVKEVIELHQGKIDFISNSKTFKISLFFPFNLNS